MVQYIDFFVTAHNKYTAERVKFVIENLKDQGTIKKWNVKEDDATAHFSVNGTWTAYSTISAMTPKKKSENPNLLLSIEHFEDDN